MIPVRGWFEDAVIGLLHLTSIVFGIFTAFGIHSFEWTDNLKGHAAYVIPIVASASYLYGAAFTRAQAVLENLAPNWMKLALRGQRFQQLATESNDARYVRFLQQGSDPLIQTLEANRRTLRLFRSLIGAIPILGIVMALWLADSKWERLCEPTILATVFATGILGMAHRQQYQTYYAAVVEADRLLQQVD